MKLHCHAQAFVAGPAQTMFAMASGTGTRIRWDYHFTLSSERLRAALIRTTGPDQDWILLALTRMHQVCDAVALACTR